MATSHSKGPRQRLDVQLLLFRSNVFHNAWWHDIAVRRSRRLHKCTLVIFIFFVIPRTLRMTVACQGGAAAQEDVCHRLVDIQFQVKENGKENIYKKTKTT
eukprot:GHVU01217555.1.p5 GENE.GHVU01217555.1~~GHVU01217555.1.p5  ORF type:complete len:101 (+),score=4.98 GHVU01217555.1:913-1215(+)